MVSPITANITSKIYSTLGSDNSLIPLFIKDTANSMGLTAGAYATGDKLESKDRFIDEFGTQAIWLLGIPAYKKAIDFTLYKVFGIDPKVDVRNFKNITKEGDKIGAENLKILEKAKEFAPTEKIKNAITNAHLKQNTFKGLFYTKFAAATALTILTYGALTKYRHKHTEEEAKKEILEEYQKLHPKGVPSMDNFIKGPQGHLKTSFDAFFNGKQSNPTFTGGLQNFMFNPVKNLMIVDAAISSERIVKSRDDQDRLGFIVKEAGFWTFMYLAKSPIQKFLEKASARTHGIPIDLDSTVIESERLHKKLNTPKMLEDLKAITEIKSNPEIYDFIHSEKGKKNIVVQMAEKCDIIPRIKQNWVQKMFNHNPEGLGEIDTRKFLDIEEFKAFKDKLATLNECAEKYIPEAKEHRKLQQVTNKTLADLTDEQAFEMFMKKVKTLKRNSTLKNMGACIGALGIAIPAIMVALRFSKKDNKEFSTKQRIMEELIASGQIESPLKQHILSTSNSAG